MLADVTDARNQLGLGNGGNAVVRVVFYGPIGRHSSTRFYRRERKILHYMVGSRRMVSDKSVSRKVARQKPDEVENMRP